MAVPTHSPYVIIGGEIHGLSAVFAEDISVVEGMQRGRASPAFDGGLFTPLMDVPTHQFHQWFLSRFERNTTRAVS